MEKLRCPECHDEFDSEGLRENTSLGYCIVYCPTCQMWRDEDEYMVADPYTCANCQFKKSGKCKEIMVKLGLSGYFGNAHDDFYCSLWEEKTPAPFRVEKPGSVWELHYGDKSCSQCFAYLDSARRICDWLNSLWDERIANE